MRNIYTIFACIILTCFVHPFSALAAELLQVRTASMLQIGDRNRSYAVQLACIEIYPQKERAAIAWLKDELPRHTKVNLRPQGSIDGTLLARVFPLNMEQEVGKAISLKGYGRFTCK